jgi:hypothetical protein
MPITNKITSRYYVYPMDIVQFLEYCERFGLIKHVDVKFVVDEEVIDESILYKKAFVCDVTFQSDMDCIKFQNIFCLFFKNSKYCMNI